MKEENCEVGVICRGVVDGQPVYRGEGHFVAGVGLYEGSGLGNRYSQSELCRRAEKGGEWNICHERRQEESEHISGGVVYRCASF